MKWIPISELRDDEKIWAGNRIRLYNVGLTIKDKTDDFYEYLVSFVYGNEQVLQLTCLSQGEAGNIICVINKDIPNHYALGAELKRMMDMDNTFINLEYV